MKKKIILNLIHLLEDDYFYYHEESIQLKISSNQNEIQVVGKDSDDSEIVLDSFFIDVDIKIGLYDKCVKINGTYLFYDC
jgi:hypothetical protein